MANRIDSTSYGNRQTIPSNLPLGFELSEDGTSAFKKITIESNGEKNNVIFNVYFSDKIKTESDKIKILNQFSEKKIQTLGQKSIELGLGTKFQAINFVKDSSGRLEKLDLHRYDGRVKTINQDYFNKKRLKIQDLGDLEKLTRFEKKLKVFESIEKISNSIKPVKVSSKPKDKTIKEPKKEKERLQDQIKEERELLKDWYVGERKTVDILDEYINKHKHASKEQVLKWVEKNIFENPDLHKID